MIKLYNTDYNKTNGTLGIKIPINTSEKDNRALLFNMSYTTEEQAVSNYINLLLTNPGERFMHPDFGVGLYLYLFEQNTTLIQTDLTDSINVQCEMWLPYIFNHQINVTNESNTSDIDNHFLKLNIVFSVTEFGANKELSFFGDPSGVIHYNIT